MGNVLAADTKKEELRGYIPLSQILIYQTIECTSVSLFFSHIPWKSILLILWEILLIYRFNSSYELLALVIILYYECLIVLYFCYLIQKYYLWRVNKRGM